MKYWILPACLGLITSCALTDRENLVYGDEESVPVVHARAETTPVASADDAADDPAIWINPVDPSSSLVLGTDKQAGLAIYTLDGNLMQFIPAGEPNNVDLRQGLQIGQWQGDLAVTSNRIDDSITLFSITAEGGRVVGSFPAGFPEPYGICMGQRLGETLVFATYKTGEVHTYRLLNITSDRVEQELIASLKLDTQLEGCVYDDATGTLLVGEEDRGLWRSRLRRDANGSSFTTPELVDEAGGSSGTRADIEGIALYSARNGAAYIITSSQGNDSYAVYEYAETPRFIGRFRIAANAESGIDGSQETDGLEAVATALGADYPEGILIVQDGYNAPRQAQNFKFVDWRDIKAALNLD